MIELTVKGSTWEQVVTNFEALYLQLLQRDFKPRLEDKPSPSDTGVRKYEVIISPLSDIHPGDIGVFKGIHAHSDDLVLAFTKDFADPANMNGPLIRGTRQYLFPPKHVREVKVKHD